MLKLFWSILLDQFGATLAITRKTSNTLITASGFNTNYDEIEAVVNGGIANSNVNASAAIAYSKLNLSSSIVNADISASAAIADSKLAQITTASKVHGSAITALNSIPNSSGPLDETNGGTGLATITTGDIFYGSASNVISALAAGTLGKFLKQGSSIPTWAWILGARASLSLTPGTAVQITNGDAHVTGYITNVSSAFTANIKTDSNSTPTTVVQKVYNSTTVTNSPFSVMVKSGDYIMIDGFTTEGTITAYKIPLTGT